MHIPENKLRHQTIYGSAGRTSLSSACRRSMRGKAREDWLFSVSDIKKCNFYLLHIGYTFLSFTSNSNLLYWMIMCPAYYTLQEVMHNMGQRFEQVSLISGDCRKSLMAERVITSTLQSLSWRNAISEGEWPWHFIVLYTSTTNSKYRTSTCHLQQSMLRTWYYFTYNVSILPS